MQTEDILMNGWLNPLLFDIVDEPWGPSSVEPNLDNILEILCTPSLEHDITSVINRGKKISKNSLSLSLVPNEKKFLERLIWPLRHAKAGYMLGNYLGTIALCGFVAEMLAILLYDIANVSLNGQDFSAEKEKMLLGSKYEKLGQARRVAVLRAIDQIDEEVKNLFNEIKNIRNKYLHLYSSSYEKIESDTVAIFQKTVNLIVKAIGLKIYSGRVSMRPDLIEYMRKIGLFKKA
ncbi:MAG: hypothetical protein WC962_05135 [Phycisphaerae bacterium]|jgi:hypothetical protein